MNYSKILYGMPYLFFLMLTIKIKSVISYTRKYCIKNIRKRREKKNYMQMKRHKECSKKDSLNKWHRTITTSE